MRTLAWVLITAAAAGLVLGALALWRVLRIRAARTRNRAVATAACGASASARVPIFVSIVAAGPLQADAALRTMVSAMGSATCPLRVYIGVAEYSDPTAPPTTAAGKNLADRFVHAAKQAAVPFELGDHVRILRAPLAEFAGVNVAREQVQRFLYHAEKYVLLLHPGVQLATGWDTTLPDALAHATRRAQEGTTGALQRRVVLSSRPPPATTPGTLGTFLGVHTARPTFVSFPMRAPAGGTAAPSVPALAWSGQLSFCEGPLPLAGGAPLFDPAEDDAVMTSRLLTLGWVLAHPTARVASLTLGEGPPEGREGGASRLASPWGAPGPALAPEVRRLLGISDDNTVTHRGRLGLVPGPNCKDELAVKVGSTGDVLSMLSRIELQQRRQEVPQERRGPHAAQPIVPGDG